MKPSEIRSKVEKELLKLVEEKKENLFGLRLQLAMGQLAKTASIGQLKKDIARIYTILKQKEGKDGRGTEKKS